MKKIAVSAMVILALALAGIASAQDAEKGKVELKMAAEKEVAVTGADGSKTVERVPAEKVIPGELVIYTITFTNKGDKPAENLVVKNPIPEHMKYVDGSAAGENCAITYSVDNVKTYDVPEKLTVKDSKGNTVKVMPSDYTNIRWTLAKPVAPESSGIVSFKAKLE